LHSPIGVEETDALEDGVVAGVVAALAACAMLMLLLVTAAI